MTGHRPPSEDSSTDVVRWAAFSCVLVPVVLVCYGTSLAGAAGTALGLAAVTAVWRILLRQSERGAARLRAGERGAPPACGRRSGRLVVAVVTGAAPGPGEAVVTPGEIHRSADRFPCTRTILFSQLPHWACPLARPPLNPRSTCTDRVSGALRTLRGLATATRRTSLHGPRVQRFVIECFTPSCHVDNVPDDELVTPAPRDTVDSILTSYGGGLVQDRGETCWSDMPDKVGAPRPPRGA